MIEVVIALLFVLFMFLVDYRLNKIYQELKKLNDSKSKL